MNVSSYLRLLALGVFAAICIPACEDPVPDDYTEQLVLQGFVIGGEPLQDIRVYRTLAMNDTFSLAKAVISNAQVTVKEDDVQIPVMFLADTNGGSYRAVDTTYRVKNGAVYSIEVVVEGRTLTASTRIPVAFSYSKPPVDTIRYPGKNNETKRYDSLNISWQPVAGTEYYVIGLTCLDTVNYGSYLTPPSADTNKRLREEDLLDDGTLITSEQTRYGFALTAETPVVWSAFKWYGQHTLRVYAGDKAFSTWFRMVGSGRRSNYDYRLSNVTGGLGIWGGASVVSAPFFLKKL